MRMKYSLPSLHLFTILLLWVSIIVNGIFSPTPVVLVEHSALILISSLLAHGVWKRNISYNPHLQDTLISALILIGIIHPSQSLQQMFSVVFIVLMTFWLRIWLRNKYTPFFNPAAAWILVATILLWMSAFEVPLISWWLTNYTITLLEIVIPIWTLISMVLYIAIMWQFKKWFYSLSFLLVYLLGIFFIEWIEFLNYIVSDGTIFFFLWVMACEPKTSPVDRIHQVIVGLVLWVSLLLYTTYDVTLAHIIAIVTANVFTIFLKNAKKIPFVGGLLGL